MEWNGRVRSGARRGGGIRFVKPKNFLFLIFSSSFSSFFFFSFPFERNKLS